MLAIARLYLDNIENVQASWVTQGLKVLELGLHFGGNDVGSVMLEENVVKAAGTKLHHRRRTAPHHPRRRVQARAARHVVSHDVPELTPFRCAFNRTFCGDLPGVRVCRRSST